MAASSVLVTVVVLLFACASVKLSCGAVLNNPELQQISVTAHTEKIVETIESLAGSKILLDQTSPQSSPSSSSPKSILPKVTTEIDYYDIVDSSQLIKETAIHSPLHVAQCRATCLEKFVPTTTPLQKQASDPIAAEAAGAGAEPGKMDEMLIVPTLFRSKRKRRSTAGSNKSFTFSSTACFQDSLKCLPCWESCQLLETKTFSAAAYTTNFVQYPCGTGCKVASSFYTQLIANSLKSSNEKILMSNVDPVVRTKQESALRFVHGKITWPALSFDVNEPSGGGGPVVFAMIQESSDGKWKQIAEQTTELELNIPSNLRKVIQTNFEAVRVLAVGAQGLYTVYSPTADSSRAASESDGHIAQVSHSESETPEWDPVSGPIDNRYVLKLVSLIHQKSLVIAELKWDETGDNPSHDYLITWELAGGGLKGHLVTGTTSVTLSLWPDATYQIQVAQFIQNLDADGEQAALSGDNLESSRASFPVFLDTSMASFPVERPSALLASKMTYEDNNEEDTDERMAYGGKTFSREAAHDGDGDKLPYHKFSVKVFCIAFASLVLVLLILTLAAYIYLKFGMLLAPKKSCEKLYHQHEDDEEEDECSGDCGEYGATRNGMCFCKEKQRKHVASQEHLCLLQKELGPPCYSNVGLYHAFAEHNGGNLYRNNKHNLEEDTTCRGRGGRAGCYDEHYGQNGYTDFHGYQDEIEKSVYSEHGPVPPLAVISYSSALSSLAVEENISGDDATAQGSLFDSYHNNYNNCSTLFNCSSSSGFQSFRHGGLQQEQVQ